MTDQRELDRVLGTFFADSTDELADRVIDGALDQIDRTPQRHALRLPRWVQTKTMLTRLLAAAVIGVFAIGGTLYLLQRGQPAVGSASPTPAVTASPGTPASTPTQDLATATSPSGPLGDGRQIQTATRLSDGRVLVAGGYALGDGALASAVLYDAESDTFSPTGSMADARGYHTATLLPDGRVLIVGGSPAAWGTTEKLASAEIYDPQTGMFSPTGAMPGDIDFQTATLLVDGRVLVAGGNSASQDGISAADLYDPRTGTFTATGPMADARTYHTATLLGDGRVLVAGGYGPRAPLASAELYDPNTGSFSPAGGG